MANRSITSPTAALIYASWEKDGNSARARTYLGASSIGHECDMFLWLKFRGAFNEKFDGRMFRLFDRGQREEAVFCNDLRRIGCEVKEIDEKTGQQFSVSAFGGHFGGHLDGVCRGLKEAPAKWHVTEFKTHSDSSFRKLVKEGVQKAKPMHFAQMTVYMGLTGIEDSLYMAVDKDNDDLYCERVKFSKNEYDAIMDRAKHIIDTTDPVRCAKRPDDFRCKACPAKSLCWHETKTFVEPSIPLSCRTCCFSTAITDTDGACWSCSRGHSCSTLQDACDDYLILPALVNATLKEGGESGITYEFKDGKTVTIGPSGISANEAKMIGPETAEAAVSVIESVPGASVVGSNAIEMKYSSRPEYYEAVRGTNEQVRTWCEEHPYLDWTKPTNVAKFDGVHYFEYEGGGMEALVVINGDDSRIVTNLPPF